MSKFIYPTEESMFNSKLDIFMFVIEVMTLRSSNIETTMSSTIFNLDSTKQENEIVVLAVWEISQLFFSVKLLGYFFVRVVINLFATKSFFNARYS